MTLLITSHCKELYEKKQRFTQSIFVLIHLRIQYRYSLKFIYQFNAESATFVISVKSYQTVNHESLTQPRYQKMVLELKLPPISVVSNVFNISMPKVLRGSLN